MNDNNEFEELRKQVEDTARMVHRLKLSVAVLSVAFLILAVALFNDNLRAATGVVLAVIGILVAVLLFIAGVRFVLERISPSPQEPAASASQVRDPSQPEEAV